MATLAAPVALKSEFLWQFEFVGKLMDLWGKCCWWTTWHIAIAIATWPFHFWHLQYFVPLLFLMIGKVTWYSRCKELIDSDLNNFPLAGVLVHGRLNLSLGFPHKLSDSMDNKHNKLNSTWLQICAPILYLGKLKYNTLFLVNWSLQINLKFPLRKLITSPNRKISTHTFRQNRKILEWITGYSSKCVSICDLGKLNS